MPSLILKQQAFFYIQRLTEMAGTSVDDISKDTVEIYLVLNGKVTFTSRDYRILLEDNCLYCFCRDENIGTEVKPGTTGYVIRFSKHLLYTDDYECYGPDFSAFNSLILREEIIKVSASFLKEGKQLCDMMYHEFRYHNEFSTQILSGFLGIFLLHLIRKSDLFMYISSKKNQHVLVRRFNALLEQEFKTSKRVSYYATMLSITPSHLNEIIKQATGRSAGSHIRERIVLEAVRQAKLRGASLKEVAYDLGFSDNAHFSKFFKKVAGTNFSDIKRHQHGKSTVPSPELSTLAASFPG